MHNLNFLTQLQAWALHLHSSAYTVDVSWSMSEGFRPLIDKNWMTEITSSLEYIYSVVAIFTCDIFYLLFTICLLMSLTLVLAGGATMGFFLSVLLETVFPLPNFHVIHLYIFIKWPANLTWNFIFTFSSSVFFAHIFICSRLEHFSVSYSSLNVLHRTTHVWPRSGVLGTPAAQLSPERVSSLHPKTKPTTAIFRNILFL